MDTTADSPHKEEDAMDIVRVFPCSRCSRFLPPLSALEHPTSVCDNCSASTSFDVRMGPLPTNVQSHSLPYIPPPLNGKDKLNRKLPFGKWTTKAVILNNTRSDRDISTFLVNSKPNLCAILAKAMDHHKQIAFHLSLYLQCNEEDTKPQSFESKVVALYSNNDIETNVDVVITLIKMEFNEQGGTVNAILNLELTIEELQKRRGSYLPLPPDITMTRSVVNVKNFDNFCFKWAIIAGVAKIKASNLHRITIYEIPDIRREIIEFSGLKLDFSGLRFPVAVWDTRIFEERNPNTSVNVFGFEVVDGDSKIIGPLYRTRKEKATHVNLLYFEDNEHATCHYASIRAMSRLLRKQITKVHNKVEICNMCLKHFSNPTSFLKHKKCKKFKVL